jgi:hypothetical protein
MDILSAFGRFVRDRKMHWLLPVLVPVVLLQGAFLSLVAAAGIFFGIRSLVAEAFRNAQSAALKLRLAIRSHVLRTPVALHRSH